jgi:hypothetical protein
VRYLKSARTAQALSEPNWVVWLDCVGAEYFLDLRWRTEPCEINNREHARQ